MRVQEALRDMSIEALYNTRRNIIEVLASFEIEDFIGKDLQLLLNLLAEDIKEELKSDSSKS